MKKTGMFAGVATTLAAVLGALALTAGAQPAAHTSGCVRGKEANGCKFNGTAYGDLKSRLIVTFPFSGAPKGTVTELSVPVTSLCPHVTEEVSLFVKGKGPARVGSTIGFSGKTIVKSSTTLQSTSSKVKSAKITGKLKITNAKTASLSGKAQITFEDGSKCSKQLPKKLLRILGG